MNRTKEKVSAILLLISAAAFADVKPASVFTDGAVLQRNEPVRIWGTADAGETVEVLFAGQKKSAVADQQGKWMITLDAMPLSKEGRPLVIRGSQTPEPVELNDLLVGEVWLAGGQSNMFSKMRNYSKTTQPDIDSANDPMLRMVTIPRLEFAGQNDDRPQWLETTPEHVANFSASAYYFAKNLREALNVPVGIVSCSVGATPAEAWMSRETLSSTPGLKRILDSYDREEKKQSADLENYLRLIEERERALEEWHEIRKSGAKPIPPYPADVMGPRNYKRPGGLYETMLTQTIPYTIRGVIWYQGENNANAGAGFHYRTVFPALINEWRTEFINPNMPFLFVQLAPFGPASDTTAKWPELRESQQWVADHVEHCGMVVLTDGGEVDNIHPHSKDKVGYRLSLLARNLVYGETNLLCHGPVLQEARPFPDRIELSFVNRGEGLILKETEIPAFEICGADGNFVPAQVRLDGDTVVVCSPDVTDPLYVRYGWKKWFETALFNSEGLPAAPFRTDGFPRETEDRYYLDDL